MLWDFLNRDVALIGDLSSPVLSWLGACGMVAFVAWQALKLKKEVAIVHRAFKRVDPIVAALVEGRQNLVHDPFTPASINRPPTQDTPPTAPIRVDRDDLHALDACMEQEPLFRGLWAQFRRTLMLEQVPWFLEPRIFGTRRAAEVFTQDALFANYVNLGFYRHLPSLVTGFGLLLTFLALLIGLGKLHAEGSEIVGIQGLINGLAGKFLTSIVGLSMAQLFLFIERPLISRLTSTHQKFLVHIDQLFSRKTVESMMEELLSLQRQRQNAGPTKNRTHSEEGRGWEPANPAKPTTELTDALHALTKCQEEEQAQTRRTMTELPHLIRGAVEGSMQEFTHAIQQLSQGLRETGGGESANPAKPTTELTAALHALTKCQEEEQAQTRRTVTELLNMIREAMQEAIEEFTISIQELSQGLRETGGGEAANPAKPTTELTDALHALTKCQEEEQAQTRRTMTELPHVIREAVEGSMQEFTHAIQQLSQRFKEVQPDSTPGEKVIDDRPLLWKTAAYPRDTSKDNLLDKIAAWPRRQEPPKHRRTG